MIEVHKPGLLTTVQDLGRRGYQKYGVSPGGAADTLSHRLANIAIGNKENAPTLEMTLQGDELFFHDSALISITGADMKPEVEGEAVPMWRPVYVEKGWTLRFRNAGEGIRTYMAIEGGFRGDVFLGSASTYLSMKAGGYNGSALEKGDLLRIEEASSLNKEMIKQLRQRAKAQGFSHPDWRVPGSSFFHDGVPGEIRAFPGRHYHLFTTESSRTFERNTYKAGSKSDRMGVRLEGEKLSLQTKKEIISEPVTFGTIQVPANGQPILLLADRQTTGGYPKFAQVASVEFSKVAQLRPGEEIRFRKISHRGAERLLLSLEDQLCQCRVSVKRKVREGRV